MPNIDDLLAEHAKEIAEEQRRFAAEMNVEIPRDPQRRPWNDGARAPENSAPAQSPFEKNPTWYSSLPTMRNVLWAKKKFLLSVFLVMSTLTLSGAYFVPVKYNSALQLYAPDKTDNIGTRMQLFANRVEFASFPMDFKVPLGLIVRRLKNAPARKWVLQQYALKKPAANFDENSVSAETFYAEGSELLVIQGYANDPVAAAEITNLYWDYLENEIKAMRDEHLQKVAQWIDITHGELLQKFNATTEAVGHSGDAGAGNPGKTEVMGRMAQSYADLSMKKMRLRKELDDLAEALEDPSGDVLLAASDSEIADLKRIVSALHGPGSDLTPEQIKAQTQDIMRHARELTETKVGEKKFEVNSVEAQLVKVRAQLAAMQGNTSEQKASDLHVKDLILKQESYQNQLEELEKLKNQIAVEARLTHLRLRPIQPALPDVSSRRPMISVLIATALILSLFLTLCALSLHLRSNLNSRRPSWS